MKQIIFLIAALLASTSAQSAETIRPGKWQMISKTDALSIPGMPVGLASKMQGGSMTITSCITPEQAKDNPRALFESSKGKCSYSKFNMAGGKLDSVAVCEQQGAKMTISSSGTYSATDYAMASNMVTSGKQPGMTIKTHVVGKWLGDCSK
jgi:Protein of unknown function (DUF3617)